MKQGGLNEIHKMKNKLILNHQPWRLASSADILFSWNFIFLWDNFFSVNLPCSVINSNCVQNNSINGEINHNLSETINTIN